MLDSVKTAALEFIESQLGDDVLERINALEVQLVDARPMTLGSTQSISSGFSPSRRSFTSVGFELSLTVSKIYPTDRRCLSRTTAGSSPSTQP